MTSNGQALSRRHFLQLSAAGAGGLALAGLSGCSDSPGKSGGPVVLAVSPDLKDLIAKPIKQFATGGTQVKVRVMPADTGQFFDQMRTQLQAGAAEIDVFMGDISWPIQFGSNGWLADISSRFDAGTRAQYFESAVKANTWKGKIYGLPWFTDAGILYYRKDLLEASGYSAPPATWAELQQMAAKVSKDKKVRNGFVFQGAQYEGGTVNGLEFIRSAGGDVLTDGKVTVNSAKAIRGLQIQRSMVQSGVSPRAVAQFKEDESGGAFMNGDAVFLRNWPFMYASLADPEASKVRTEQVGVAELPVAEAGHTPVNVGGGWNFMINAKSGRQDAAWKLAQFMSAPAQQKVWAAEGGYMPTRPSVFDDPEVIKAQPVLKLAKAAAQHTTTPPTSPNYSDMSLAMAQAFNESLRGAASPEQTAERLQAKLERIVK